MLFFGQWFCPLKTITANTKNSAEYFWLPKCALLENSCVNVQLNIYFYGRKNKRVWNDIRVSKYDTMFIFWVSCHFKRLQIIKCEKVCLGSSNLCSVTIYCRFLFFYSALCFFPGLPWYWQSSLLSVFLLSYSSLPHLPQRESGVSLMYLTQMLTLWVFSVCLSTDVCLSVAVFASVSLSCLSV